MLVDGDTFEKIKDFERSDLSARQKLILRLTDAYLTGSGVDAALRVEVLEEFTPEQAVALTLKAVNYTSQKMLVVLGADLVMEGGERTEDGFRVMHHDSYIDALAGDQILLPTVKRQDI